ncbi:MAG: hypothetical protein GY852_08835 [bacterium]|nr:hypothetical protein [bacterium]
MIFEMYKKMFQVLRPSNVEKFSKKEKGTIRGGITVYFLSWVVWSALILAGFYLGGNMVTASIEPIVGLFGLGGLLGLMGYLAYALLAGIIGQYVYTYVTNFCATKFLGGKNKFEQLFYMMMLIGAGFAIIQGLFLLVSILSEVLFYLSLLISIYIYYLMIVAIREIYKFTTVKAIIALIAGYVVNVLVFAAIGLVVLAVALAVGAVGGT